MSGVQQRKENCYDRSEGASRSKCSGQLDGRFPTPLTRGDREGILRTGTFATPEHCYYAERAGRFLSKVPRLRQLDRHSLRLGMRSIMPSSA